LVDTILAAEHSRFKMGWPDAYTSTPEVRLERKNRLERGL